MTTPTPPPRLVPDRPSDAAIAQAAREQYEKNGTFLHYHLLIRRACEIDAAAPPAEAPWGWFPFVEELGPTGTATGYLIREGSDAAQRNYDLFVSNVRAALGKHYDAEAGMICSIALLAAERDQAPRVTGGREDSARLDWMDRQAADSVHVEVCCSGNFDQRTIQRKATVYVGRPQAEFTGGNVREAIDAALQAATGGGEA